MIKKSSSFLLAKQKWRNASRLHQRIWASANLLFRLDELVPKPSRTTRIRNTALSCTEWRYVRRKLHARLQKPHEQSALTRQQQKFTLSQKTGLLKCWKHLIGSLASTSATLWHHCCHFAGLPASPACPRGCELACLRPWVFFFPSFLS